MASNFLTPEAILDSLKGSFSDTLSLTTFESTMWLARTQDANAAAILAKHANADPDALNVSKYLFQGTTRHKVLCGAIRHAYAVHKEKSETLSKHGLRVIGNAGIGQYLTSCDAENEVVEDKLKDFEDNYDADKQIGMQHLGDLAEFADELYKQPHELRDCFGISYEPLLPFPTKDGYGSMNEATLQRLQMNLESSIRSRVAVTFDTALNTFMDALELVHERVTQRAAGEKVKLTEAVLTAPVERARMLRHFARGDWADRMGQIESLLETWLGTPKLSQSQNQLIKVRDGLTVLIEQIKKA